MLATVAVYPAAAEPPATIRLLPAPRSEPPTDQELTDAGLDAPPMTAPLLPFDLPSRASATGRGRTERRPAAQRAAAAALAASSPAGHAGAAPANGARIPTNGARIPASGASVPGHGASVPANPALDNGPEGSAAASPPTALAPPDPSPAQLATRRFLATCVEVIGGFRPVTHLRPLCLPEAFGDIMKRLTARSPMSPHGQWRGHASAAGRTPVTGRTTGAPPRAGRTSQTGPGERVSVRRVQICDAREDAAEVAVVLARREQVWAMALRLERVRDRWLCAYLEVL